MNVGERIRYVREMRGLSQDDLAELLHLKSKSSICKIEKAGNDVSTKSVEKYAMVLGVSPSYLMGWSGEYDISLNADSMGLFIEFCDQYRKKDGKNIADLFKRYLEENHPNELNNVGIKWLPPLE